MNKTPAVAEIHVSYTPHKDRPVVTSAEQAYAIFKHYWNADTIELLEESKVLLLNRASEVLGIYPLAKGGINSVIVDARIIFSIALKGNACGFILAHNHPSGNLTPSDADIMLTQKLKEAGLFMDIKLIDHLIITSTSFKSITECL